MGFLRTILLSTLAFSSVHAAVQKPCLDDLVQISVSDAELVLRAQGYAKALAAKTGKGMTRENFPAGDRIRANIHGVPWDLKIKTADPKRIFRHYVGIRMEETLAQIKKTGRLVAGPTPYVRSDYPPRWFKETYLDLTGVFLTLPKLDPEMVGVFDSPYVDVQLPSGIPIVEIEDDRIFFVPGPTGELVVPVTLVE